MSEQKTYKLYISLILKINIFFGLGIFAFSVIKFIDSFVPYLLKSNSFYWFMLIFIFVAFGCTFYWIFSFPHRITVSNNGEIVFIGLLRRWQVKIDELESVKPNPWSVFGVYIVKTRNKKIRILNRFDGFHDLLTYIKAENPSIELRGC